MFNVYEKCCGNCLLSTERIVSPQRAKDLVKDCLQQDTYFVCHKSTMQDDGGTCCKAFYDKFGQQINLVRIAQRLGVVKFVPQPDIKKLTPHKNYAKEK